MSLKNKILHSVIVSATAIGLAASFSAPVQAADGSDVALGLIGGLIIASVFYQTRKRRANNGYVTSNRRNYYNPRYNYRYPEYNRYGHEARGRDQFDHGRHNRSNRY